MHTHTYKHTNIKTHTKRTYYLSIGYIDIDYNNNNNKLIVIGVKASLKSMRKTNDSMFVAAVFICDLAQFIKIQNARIYLKSKQSSSK